MKNMKPATLIFNKQIHNYHNKIEENAILNAILIIETKGELSLETAFEQHKR